MSTLRTTLAAALTGAAFLAAPAALAQQSTVTGETMRAVEGMKTDAINRNAEEVVKEQQKAMPAAPATPDAAAKPTADEMEKAKKMDMPTDKKTDGEK